MATRRQAQAELWTIMDRFQWDLAHRATREGAIPEEWREVWQNRSCAKRKVSLWVDEDVWRLFRSMGSGVGPRMNQVLRAFMLARMGALLDGEDLSEVYREEWMGKPKPWHKSREGAAMLEDVEEMRKAGQKK
jgi:uncharacterized protein (DUF4415 family)